MPRRLRLDAELVRRGMARSREHASELIHAGRVSVNGHQASKPATAVLTDADLVVRADATDLDYASRGAHKLAGALADFPGLLVSGRRCLDAGASTGGFTDVLLRAGAAEVVAVDVGYGQLIWRLQNDPRVLVLDRTNIREMDPDLAGGAVDLVVGDLSFISLRLVLPALTGLTAVDADLLLMVKPQFEVGKDRLGKGGVVRDPQLRAEAVCDVVVAAQALGWHCHGVTTSQLPGPSGNVEFFVWLNRAHTELTVAAISEVVRSSARPGVPDESLSS